MLAAVLVVAAGLAARYGETAAAQPIVEALAMLASVLLVGAGLVRIARWRLAGDPRDAVLGAAFASFGGLAVPLSELANPAEVTGPVLHPVVGMMATVAGGVMVLIALHGRIRPDVRPLRLAAAAILPTLVGCAVLLLLRAITGAGAIGTTSHLVLELATGLLWTSLLVVVLVTGERHGDRDMRLGAALIGGLAGSSLCRAAAVLDPQQWSLPAAALFTTTAGLLLLVATRDLEVGATGQQLTRAEVSRALEVLESELRAVRRSRRVLTHDSRNAMAALRLAVTALAVHGDRLSRDRIEELRTGVLAEINDLDQMLEGGEQPAKTDQVQVVPRQRSARADINSGTQEQR